MNRFERWFIQGVFRREVCQGYDHDFRIANLYRMVREACEKEFAEDTAPTIDASLREWFETTQHRPMWQREGI